MKNINNRNSKSVKTSKTEEQKFWLGQKDNNLKALATCYNPDTQTWTLTSEQYNLLVGQCYDDGYKDSTKNLITHLRNR